MFIIKDKNICKFIPISANLGLDIACFILESNYRIISSNKKSSRNTAILITKGNGILNCNNDSIAYSAGSLIFIFKNEEYFAICDEETEYMYITFGGVRSEELFKRFGISRKNRCFSNYDGLIPMWKESLSRANENTVDLAAESMLLYAFSRLLSFTEKKNAIINSITEISENRFMNPELSISVIAKELGYNHNYLSHFFKEKTGVTYSEYLRNLRIKYAITLLEHGIDSVKNIAALSGFDNPLYFSTVFKKSVGVSPKEYIGKLSKK